MPTSWCGTATRRPTLDFLDDPTANLRLVMKGGARVQGDAVMANRFLTAVAAAIVATTGILAPATSQAQDWSGQVTLYGLGRGASAETSRPFNRCPDAVFRQVAVRGARRVSNAAVFVTGLARRGDLVIFGDLTYSSSSRDGLTSLGPASGEVTLPVPVACRGPEVRCRWRDDGGLCSAASRLESPPPRWPRVGAAGRTQPLHPSRALSIRSSCCA